MKTSFLTFFVLCFGVALAASSASAGLVTWNFNPLGANTDVSSSTKDYMVSGFTIAARGFNNVSGPDTPHNLRYKDESGDLGLGVVGTPHFEIQVDSHGNPLQYIQLDLRSILTQGFTNGQISVGSVEPGETFFFYGSNILGELGDKLNGTAFGSGSDGLFVNVPLFGTYKFVSVVSGSMDVLPVAFRAQVAPIPEASSSVLTLLGLIIGATAHVI